MKTLITGGAGFIGSHLAEELLGQGHRVSIIDDLSTGQFKNIAHLTNNPDFKFAIDTITNEVVLDRLVGECDIVFHLAAAVGVKLIIENPLRTIETNILGTESVFKVASRYKAKVIIASTSEVYGKNCKTPFLEDDDVILGPTSRCRWSYAASKMMDEFLGLAYFYEKKLPVVICRFFNTIGPRQLGRYGMVVPRFIQQALEKKPLTVYGDGNQTRCFTDVSDTVNAIIGLAQCPRAIGEVFNIGSTQELSILSLAQKVLKLASGDDPISPNAGIQFIDFKDAYKPGFEDMQRRVPEISKIHATIGWKAQMNLDETLQRMIDYYRQNYDERVIYS